MREIRRSTHDLGVCTYNHVNILGNSKEVQNHRRIKNILNWKIKIQANMVPAGGKDSIANRYMTVF